MPRRARIDAPGALHHVICRGIERRRIFWEDSDRDDFLKRLETILAATQTPCYGSPGRPQYLNISQKGYSPALLFPNATPPSILCATWTVSLNPTGISVGAFLNP